MRVTYHAEAGRGAPSGRQGGHAGPRRVTGRTLAPGGDRLYEPIFMNLGFGELLIILIIVLVLFGAGRLPALGDGLGKAIRGFKDAVRGDAPPPPPEAKKELPPDAGSRK